MKYGPFVGAVLLAGLIVTATLFTAGCDLFDDDEGYPQGQQGASCTHDSQCISNSCVYPGVCQ